MKSGNFMDKKTLQWFQLALKLKGSVVPGIIKRVLVCGAFGVFISVLYYLKAPVFWKSLESVVPSIVLGLLLVFRTNTACLLYTSDAADE